MGATRLVLAASKSISHIFNIYDMYRRSSSTLLARLYQQSTLIFATMPSEISSFNDCGGPRVRSSSLAYWNFRWTVLKPYIVPRHKRLI